MNADKKTTTSVLPSGPTPSQNASILRRIAPNGWTLLYIVLFTASIRCLWGYMQWPNGGDLALALHTGLLILYLVIWRYVDGQ
ncbi:hypothetical protein M752DRAFT_273767 [Aspergillus phoenicis ATCC 13157]|uniref:Uncharacterized protein n=1 Tax=Aspergillus phoenicis ATCC 13157 TaxID=1353007 RepID=A0A370PTF8_ASPPH|nr:hypothetical protein M752DRAFT_273767 [Aspergillus phoenicis ATCC 13157]